jgi:hypothetical protein
VYNFELPSKSQPSLGYATLLSTKPTADVRLNCDLLTQASLITLSDAVASASVRTSGLPWQEASADMDLMRAACHAAD